MGTSGGLDMSTSDFMGSIGVYFTTFLVASKMSFKRALSTPWINVVLLWRCPIYAVFFFNIFLLHCSGAMCYELDSVSPCYIFK